MDRRVLRRTMCRYVAQVRTTASVCPLGTGYECADFFILLHFSRASVGIALISSVEDAISTEIGGQGCRRTYTDATTSRRKELGNR